MIDLSNVETMQTHDGQFSLRAGLDTERNRWLEYTVSESKEQTVYALVGMSDERYQELLNSRITVRDMFESSESGTVYKVIRRWEDLSPFKKAYIESVPTGYLSGAFQGLPEQGIYLNQS